jgi:hypothetical protein
MAEQRSDDLLRSRQEAALLLRLDPSNLSPSDALRCDLIATLRLSIDSAQADALEGRAADLGRLIVATEALVKLLPGEPPKPESHEARDEAVAPLLKLFRHLHESVNALSAENAHLKAQLAGGHGSALPSLRGDSTAIDPTLSDIVPPGERAERDAGPRRGPDDPPPRSTRIIEAVPNPPAAPAAPQYDYSREQGWKDFVEPDGTIRSTPRGRGHYFGPV